ncbi:PDDEXK family nuclease [Castellaniella sp. WN]
MTKVRGNYVSEWFGQRIYPDVKLDVSAITGANTSRCPFLSNILHTTTVCVKAENSRGVCTINSSSNGSRQDWLVCPYRVINSPIVTQACQRIFGLTEAIEPVPVSILQYTDKLAELTECINSTGVGYIFFQDKLGGEISVIGTSRSPEMAFDVTLVEIRPDNQGGFMVSRYGILELQTMDYHGTYKHAVSNLRDGLRLHQEAFAEALRGNLARWAGEGVEGPNIANVFKRTFYQMLLKFRLAGEGSTAAGTVLAIPQSVWDSWQPFLGAPELEDESPGIKRLQVAAGAPPAPQLNAYVAVFDLDATSEKSVSPVEIKYFIRISPEHLAHHAFTEVPAHILHSIQTEESVLATIKSRLGGWWPAFQSHGTRRPRRQPAPPTSDPAI